VAPDGDHLAVGVGAAVYVLRVPGRHLLGVASRLQDHACRLRIR
jgi:hypothetical protein